MKKKTLALSLILIFSLLCSSLSVLSMNSNGNQVNSASPNIPNIPIRPASAPASCNYSAPVDIPHRPASVPDNCVYDVPPDSATQRIRNRIADLVLLPRPLSADHLVPFRLRSILSSSILLGRSPMASPPIRPDTPAFVSPSSNESNNNQTAGQPARFHTPVQLLVHQLLVDLIARVKVIAQQQASS